MLRWDAENGIQRPAPKPIERPAGMVEIRPTTPARISSQAGLAALRAGARLMAPDREDGSE